MVQKGSVDLKRIHIWLASILWPDQDEDDKVLKAQLEQLEQLDQITTEDMVQHRRQKMFGGSMHIFRVKGILSIIHPTGDGETRDDAIDRNGVDNRRYIVQAVNDLWDIQPASDELSWSSTNEIPEERLCKLVVIGRHLDRMELMNGFKSCCI